MAEFTAAASKVEGWTRGSLGFERKREDKLESVWERPLQWRLAPPFPAAAGDGHREEERGGSKEKEREVGEGSEEEEENGDEGGGGYWFKKKERTCLVYV